MDEHEDTRFDDEQDPDDHDHDAEGVIEEEVIFLKNIETDLEETFVITHHVELDGQRYVALEYAEQDESVDHDAVFIHRVEDVDGVAHYYPVEDELEFLRVIRNIEEQEGLAPGTLVIASAEEEEALKDSEFQRAIGAKYEAEAGPGPADDPWAKPVDVRMTLAQLSAATLGLRFLDAKHHGAIAAGMIPGNAATIERLQEVLTTHGMATVSGEPVTVFEIGSYVPSVLAATDLTEEHRAQLLNHNRLNPPCVTAPRLGELVDLDILIDRFKQGLVSAYMEKLGIPVLESPEDVPSDALRHLITDIMDFEPRGVV
jgi:CheY-like chemotaxis protein